jgi:hypothetical protein
MFDVFMSRILIVYIFVLLLYCIIILFLNYSIDVNLVHSTIATVDAIDCFLETKYYYITNLCPYYKLCFHCIQLYFSYAFYEHELGTFYKVKFKINIINCCIYGNTSNIIFDEYICFL